MSRHDRDLDGLAIFADLRNGLDRQDRMLGRGFRLPGPRIWKRRRRVVANRVRLLQALVSSREIVELGPRRQAPDAGNRARCDERKMRRTPPHRATEAMAEASSIIRNPGF